MATPPIRTIPAEFLRLDSTVGTADEFLTSRDMQKVRDNHNILMARNMRRTVACDSMDGANIPQPYATNRRVALPFYYLPLTLPAGRKSLTVKVLCRMGGTDAELQASIYGVCDSVDMRHPDDLDGATSATITGGFTYNWLTLTNIPIMESRYAGANSNTFLYLYAEGGVVGSDLLTSGTATVDAVSPDGRRVIFSGASGTNPATGQVLYFPNDLSIGHRLIKQAINISGTQWVVYLDRVMTAIPVVGTTTVNTRRALEIRVASVVVVEDAVTDIVQDTEYPPKAS